MMSYQEFIAPLDQNRRNDIAKRGYKYSYDEDQAWYRVLTRRYDRYRKSIGMFW